MRLYWVIKIQNSNQTSRDFPRKYIQNTGDFHHRLRIGHTHLTYQHLMKKVLPPVCTSCSTPLTVKHIITECLNFEEERTNLNLSYQLSEYLNPDLRNV